MKDLELKRNAEWYSDPTAFEALTEMLKGEQNMKNFDQAEILKGEIYELVLTDKPGTKPVLIVSADDRKHSNMVSIITLNDEVRSKYAVPVICGTPLYADGSMISYANRSKLGNFIKKATDAEMKNVDAAIIGALDLDVKQKLDSPKVDEMAFLLERTEAEYKAELAEKDKAIEELTSLYEHALITQTEGSKVTAERDIYKRMYESLLERLIER